MLKIEHLTKVYGEKRAVDDLSLHIAPGEIYGFIGVNVILGVCNYLRLGKTGTARFAAL